MAEEAAKFRKRDKYPRFYDWRRKNWGDCDHDRQCAAELEKAKVEGLDWENRSAAAKDRMSYPGLSKIQRDAAEIDAETLEREYEAKKQRAMELEWAG